MHFDSISRSRTSSYISWVGARTQSTIKRSPSNFKTSWLDAQRQARSDFSARHGRGFLWVLAILWFGGLITSFVTLCVWMNGVSNTQRSFSNRLSACLPDDSFNLHPNEYSYWSNSGFFQITLGFGTLTFTQAKAIDVIWDIGVGRGGQGLIAYFSWEAFVRYVTTSMEVQPVTFNTYRMIFLQNENLVMGIPRIIRDFCKRRGLHSRCAMVFTILTMMFILVFPTLGSAMTGYSGNVLPYVPDQNGSFVRFEDFRILLYTVHDGDRINQTENFHMTVPKLRGLYYPLPSHLSYLDLAFFKSGPRCVTYEKDEQCYSEWLTWNISQYIGQYGPNPQSDVSSTFGGVPLDPPTLHITAYDLPAALNKSETEKGDFSYSSPGSSSTYLSNGRIYTQAAVADSGKCQAEKTYKWGFSFIQLNIMIILLLLWTVGISTMYLSSKLTRLRRGREDVAGEYKAVFELSDAMHTQLTQLEKEEANDVRDVTESDLRRRITKDLRGGSIAYDTALLHTGGSGAESVQWTLTAWMRREIWWMLALIVTIVVDGFVVQRFLIDGLRSDLWLFPALPLAIVFAMVVGLTQRSRLMVLLWALLVACVLPAIILGVTIQSLGLER